MVLPHLVMFQPSEQAQALNDNGREPCGSSSEAFLLGEAVPETPSASQLSFPPPPRPFIEVQPMTGITQLTVGSKWVLSVAKSEI